MDPAQYLALRVPPSALGMGEGEHAATLTYALERAERAAEALPADKQEEGTEAHALAFLFGLEAAHWRRALSGSGPDGTVTVTEVSERMKAALAEQEAQEARFAALTPAPAPVRATRGGGSVRMVVDP